MTTYIIQYQDVLSIEVSAGIQRLPLRWTNYTDDNGNNVEFVTKNGAITVAKNLAAFSEVHPSQKQNWKILDSRGNVFLAAFSEVHPSQKQNWKILDSHGNAFPLE